MQDRLRDFITARLGDPASRTPDERQEIYRRIRAAVANMPPDALGGDPLHAGYAMEAAIAEIETAIRSAAVSAATAGSPAPGGRLSGLVDRVLSYAAGFKARYAALAAGLATFTDLLKPIGEYTLFFLVASTVVGLAAAAVRPFVRPLRPRIDRALEFCLFLFLASAIWWSIQVLVPGADKKGGVAEIVPGVSAIQQALMRSVGRIEDNTKRIADIMEAQAKQEAEERARAEKIVAEMTKNVVMPAATPPGESPIELALRAQGYTLDAAGLEKAVRAGDFTSVFRFAQLQIVLPVDRLPGIAMAASEPLAINGFFSYLNSATSSRETVEYAARLAAFRNGIRATFQGSRAKSKLCGTEFAISAAALETICRMDGLEFADAYIGYAQRVWGADLFSYDFSLRALGELPITRVPGVSRMGDLTKRCAYYEVETSFMALDPKVVSVTPYIWRVTLIEQGLLQRNVVMISTDKRMERSNFDRTCNFHERAQKGMRFCRSRFLVGTPCGAVKGYVALSWSGAPD